MLTYMITVTNKIIETSPFQILRKEKTMRKTENVDYFLDMGDGIIVSIDLNIEDFAEGRIFIEQVCNNHRLSFEKDSGEICNFEITEPHYDSFKEGDPHYRSFIVTDNKILGGGSNVHFSDTLFVALEKHWTKFIYFIEFEVWVQSQVKDAKAVPICKFKWHMLAHCAFIDSIWVLNQSEWSTEAEIIRSFKTLRPTDDPIDTSTMKHLASEVSTFMDEKGLWSTKSEGNGVRI